MTNNKLSVYKNARQQLCVDKTVKCSRSKDILAGVHDIPHSPNSPAAFTMAREMIQPRAFVSSF